MTLKIFFDPGLTLNIFFYGPQHFHIWLSTFSSMTLNIIFIYDPKHFPSSLTLNIFFCGPQHPSTFSHRTLNTFVYDPQHFHLWLSTFSPITLNIFLYDPIFFYDPQQAFQKKQIFPDLVIKQTQKPNAKSQEVATQ